MGDELMNSAVTADKDKDMENMKALQENTAGSLFLKSATKTTEDMMRKLREDPLFQIRREEQAARSSLLANPLVQAKLQKKQDKASKKQDKKMKKAMKKEEKKAKKAMKKEKKAAKKGKKSSSSSSSDSDNKAPAMAPPVSSAPSRNKRDASRSPKRPSKAEQRAADMALGPGASMSGKRAEYEQLMAERKDKALASRGAPKRMSEEEKARRLAEMKADADNHEKKKDDRIAAAAEYEKKVAAREEAMRAQAAQSSGGYLDKVRRDVYVDSGDAGNLADRLKSQRHRRGKDLKDTLERD